MEADTLFIESRERARRDFADLLNQAVRRIRMAPDAEELGATLLDAAAQFSTGAALFRVSGDIAILERIRGVPDAAAFTMLEIPLASAAALASAIELLGHVAAAVWSAIPEPTPPPDLVGIAPAPAPASSWDGMPADEQRIHLRAQRFARVQVAEMRLFEAEAVQNGRAQRSLYEALRKSIDAAREIFRKTFFASCASMVDYLDLELTRTLANDNPDLLGKTYPGPLR